ncbi:TetR/AcrR family transcriptional regulator [Sporosarcina sp. ANT_H38]|uniref:TetR/AcrR family transcriptional regulator n=1 Tax=Sporosarcina sp. ANT_H38 TaxID=2597358 RepID=UPI0011F21899|nr:TetR/AcrR family transcriptional regulator [Sporosarcina sp. ANT_H38]KAA0955765.1 TetR/AcrR family transcriptional regulator [Sporosarcina sp. ANT_H38]
MNDRKRQVLLTAQRLFIDKGFSTTSVQDILDESCISKGTFYNYFSSKNECLKAILEQAHDEANVRRRELLIGQDLSDKQILVDQILVRMHVNREQNLLPLFEAVFHSGDSDLRAFIKNMLIAEFSWLTRRLVDVYGKAAEPYAADCAVMLLGMMQQILHVWSAFSKEEMDSLKLVTFLIRRIDSIILGMISTKDAFFTEDVFFKLNSEFGEQTETKEQLFKQLTGFSELLEDDTFRAAKQYVQFLLEELRSECPRVFVLESIVRSFREAFKGLPHETEAHELAYKVWRFVDTLE